MNFYKSLGPIAQVIRAPAATLFIVFCAATLSGCSSLPFFNEPTKQQPSPLSPVSGSVVAKQAWAARVGAVNFPLDIQVSGNTIYVSSSDGTLAAIDVKTGADLWRTSLGAPIAAGIGSDGTTSAVITQANDVVAVVEGREVWRQRLMAKAFTAPFVAGGRVFVLTADRSISAFDGRSGRKLWTQQRPSEPLVLQQSGVMLAVGDTLVIGLGGRLAGLNPSNGSIKWEAPIASPRGINDVERLVDLVGRVSRDGDVVCARAFQTSVGCVDAVRGNLLWSKPARGSQGIHGDDQRLYGTEADGVVTAWRRVDGERSWTTDALRYRSLTAPLVIGRSVAIGDFAGVIHLLSREDGSLLNRLTTDGSAIAAAPVLVGNTLVAVTRNGGIFGFIPE